MHGPLPDLRKNICLQRTDPLGNMFGVSVVRLDLLNVRLPRSILEGNAVSLRSIPFDGWVAALTRDLAPVASDFSRPRE